MPDRTIAIGDIHGCSQALEAVLKMVAPTADDTIITLGDYVDRGPDSKGVVERLLALSETCRHVPLLGNHEIMLLKALEDPAEMRFWLTCGGLPTLHSYGGDPASIPPEHLRFFERCLPFHETPTHFFVHANYVYDLPLETQPEFNLYWEHLLDEAPPQHVSGKKAVVGHTPQPQGEILDLGHILCIDTYCFGSGCLTALDVKTGELWQADKLGRPRGK